MTKQTTQEEKDEIIKEFLNEAKITMNIDASPLVYFLKAAYTSGKEAKTAEVRERLDAHAQFVSDTLDGIKPEEAYNSLNERLSALTLVEDTE